MVKHILKGWYNLLFSLNSDEAKRKAEICVKCEFIKKGKYEFIIDNEIKEIEEAGCSVCGCPLSAKLRSNDKCPKEKF